MSPSAKPYFLQVTDPNGIRPLAKTPHIDGFIVDGVGHIKVNRFYRASMTNRSQMHITTLTVTNVTEAGREALSILGFERQRDGTYRGNMFQAINKNIPIGSPSVTHVLQTELGIYVPIIAHQKGVPGFGKLELR